MQLLVSTARENETELKMFTSIFHAKRMKNIQRSNCWEPYKQWLRDLVELVAEDNAANPDFDYHDPSRTLPKNFGLLLSPENLDSYINELENGLKQYMNQAL